MLISDTSKTIGLKQCHICGTELLESDKFCRRCGVGQNSSDIDLAIDAVVSRDLSELENQQAPGSRVLHRSYSASLLRVVTKELSGTTSPLCSNRWAMRLVSVLVSVPIWLMIVLLSPLDAYVAVKAITKQV